MVETQGGEPGDGAAEVLDRPLPDGVRRRVVHIVSEGFGGQLAVILLAGGAGAALYVGIVLALRVQEARTLWGFVLGGLRALSRRR